jgi:hypothetical protein
MNRVQRKDQGIVKKQILVGQSATTQILIGQRARRLIGKQTESRGECLELTLATSQNNENFSVFGVGCLRTLKTQ